MSLMIEAIQINKNKNKIKFKMVILFWIFNFSRDISPFEDSLRSLVFEFLNIIILFS